MVFHANKKKSTQKISFKKVLLILTSTILIESSYTSNTAYGFDGKRYSLYNTYQKQKKKKPSTLVEQGFYDETYNKSLPQNFTPYSKNQPSSILNQGNISETDFFIKESQNNLPIEQKKADKNATSSSIIKAAEQIKQPSTNNTSKDPDKSSITPNLEDEANSTITKEKNIEPAQDSKKSLKVSKKTDSTVMKSKENIKSEEKSLETATSSERIKEKAEVKPTIKEENNLQNEIKDKINNNSTHLDQLEKRLNDLEKKINTRKPDYSGSSTAHQEVQTKEKPKEEENNNKPISTYLDNQESKSESTQPLISHEKSSDLEKSSITSKEETTLTDLRIKDQILSFIYLQNTETPKTIEYLYKGNQHVLDMNNEKSKKIIENIALTEKVLKNHPKDGSGRFTHNPLNTSYLDLQNYKSKSTTQETFCILRNGAYIITFDFQNPQKKNPSLDAGEIYVYTQMFDKSFSKKSFYIQSIKKDNKQKTYLGKIIDIGTTAIPGDTICITQDVIFDSPEEFLNSSEVKNLVPESKPSESPQYPVQTNIITTSAQRQILPSQQVNNTKTDSINPADIKQNELRNSVNTPRIPETKINTPQVSSTKNNSTNTMASSGNAPVLIQTANANQQIAIKTNKTSNIPITHIPSEKKDDSKKINTPTVKNPSSKSPNYDIRI